MSDASGTLVAFTRGVCSCPGQVDVLEHFSQLTESDFREGKCSQLIKPAFYVKNGNHTLSGLQSLIPLLFTLPEVQMGGKIRTYAPIVILHNKLPCVLDHIVLANIQHGRSGTSRILKRIDAAEKYQICKRLVRAIVLLASWSVVFVSLAMLHLVYNSANAAMIMSWAASWIVRLETLETYTTCAGYYGWESNISHPSEVSRPERMFK